MNKLIIPLLLLAITIPSCRKEKVSTIPETKTNDTAAQKGPDTSYYIPGLADKSVAQLGTLDIDFTVTQNTITDKRVTVSLGDLPPNSSGYLSVKSGYPSFSSTLHLNFRFTPAGVYPVKIFTATEGHMPKEYVFDLEVRGNQADCNKEFFHRLITNKIATTSNSPEQPPVQSPSLYNDGNLYLSYLLLHHEGTGFDYYISYRSINTPSTVVGKLDHIRLEVDCNNGNIVIPKQQTVASLQSTGRLDTFSVSGSGKVNAENGTYFLDYKSEFDDLGTHKAIEYKIEGKFQF